MPAYGPLPNASQRLWVRQVAEKHKNTQECVGLARVNIALQVSTPQFALWAGFILQRFGWQAKVWILAMQSLPNSGTANYGCVRAMCGGGWSIDQVANA